jgi:O-antigen ligase
MPRTDAVPALLAAALIALLGFDQGGYAPTSWVWSAALLAIAAGVLALGRPVRPSPHELAFLGALTALTAWTLLSAWWSLDPTGSVLEAQRLLLYLATASAVLLLARPSSRTAILFGGLAAVAALCLAGLADALVGDDPIGAVTDDPSSEERLSEPVGYANALALLAASGVLLAVGLASVVERPALRVACLALVPPLLATLYLTYGRGAWLALAVGLVVLFGSRLRAVDRRLAAALAAGLVVAVAVAATAVARSFTSATATPAEGSARLLTLSGSSRADYWRVARRDVADHPLFGSGARSYGRYWLRERPVPQPARDAHSLYLESLAELGPLGLALLLVALGAPVAAAARTWRDPLTPVALAPYAAFQVHAAQDWDWELPAATVPAFVCAVTLLLGSRRRDPPLGVPARTATAVVAAALAALALPAYAGNRELAVAEGGSEDAARRAARLQPWSAAPWRARGEAQLARDEGRRARESFVEGIERDDGDWELWLDLALASQGAERDRALARAAELNPLAPDVEQVRSGG